MDTSLSFGYLREIKREELRPRFELISLIPKTFFLFSLNRCIYIGINIQCVGARGVMVIVIGNRHGSFKNVIYKMCLEITYLISIYLLLIICLHTVKYFQVLPCGGARGVMVIVVRNGHGDTSSNPGRD